MEMKYREFSVNTVLLVLIILLQKNGKAEIICSAPDTAEVKENSPIGTVVTPINTEIGVTLIITLNPEDAFELVGSDLKVKKELDYEVLPNAGALTVRIQCDKPGFQTAFLTVIVLVENVNDNSPVFEQAQYILNVNELTPVGTSVGRVEATDIDGDRLLYRLEPETDGYFKLQNGNNPNIIVGKDIDYDTVQKLTLSIYAEDSLHTATATITVNILDVDNRPPWFQPCTVSVIGTAIICLGSGYSGTVNLTEQTPGALPLNPGPLYAIDGDKGLNEQIGYRIHGGNEAGIFHVDENSGDVTMLKPADVAGPITLTVLAYQVLNSNQFSSTVVTFTVRKKSQHSPTFEKTQYEGYISIDAEPGSMVMEIQTLNKPLQVHATDADFADGMNPDMKYEVSGSGDFTVTAQGFLLLNRHIIEDAAQLVFQIRAVDTLNDESGTTTLSVQVLPGTTTATPTTDISTTAETTLLTESTTNSPSTIPLTPSAEPTSTALGSSSTEWPSSTDSFTTSNSGPHTEGVVSPLGEYRQEDMIILGASLAVVVLLCLVTIGLLAFRIKKGKADWRKMNEASIFRSSFTQGPAGSKDGMQYTNEGFQNDGDIGIEVPTVLDALDLKMDPVLGAKAKMALEKSTPTTSSALYSNLDTGSLAGSERADSEKEVKPILTKERRNEEGYKSVWFKEDIDPDAKEEVVIIPDSRGQNVDEDEDSLDEEEEEGATPKVFFANTKTDDKAAVRFQDQDRNVASDSEGEEVQSADL